VSRTQSTDPLKTLLHYPHSKDSYAYLGNLRLALFGFVPPKEEEGHRVVHASNLRELGYQYGSHIARLLLSENQSKPSEAPSLDTAIEKLCSLVGQLGYATLLLRKREEDYVTQSIHIHFQTTDSIEAKTYLQHHHSHSTPVCNVLTGILAGFLSFYTQTTIQCQESTCQVLGNPMCIFECTNMVEHEAKVTVSSQTDDDFASMFSTPNIPDSPLQAQNEDQLGLEVSKQISSRTNRPFIFRSDAMRNIVEQIMLLADIHATVLITGESGTGKDHVAYLLHQLGQRSSKPYIPVNCAAVPENLLESELFGYKKGSFTGATKDYKGLFEASQHGTLFLDEIGEMPLALQAKLLRVLQDGTVRPLGSSEHIPVDSRIVAATNMNLEEMVKRGRFREDLFFRLNVFSIEVPPLRKRPEDIPVLIDHFLEHFSTQHNKSKVQLPSEIIQDLKQQTWNGNIRELANYIERIIVFSSQGVISNQFMNQEIQKMGGANPNQIPKHINPMEPTPEPPLLEKDIPSSPSASPVNNTLEDVEKQHIKDALMHYHGHRGKTAAALRISTVTLWRKMKTYAIPEDYGKR
jgi:DNA-binding NtrC family response regulator/predicted hydrocarbon binding protein